MKLPKTHPRSSSGFVRRHSIPGLFSVPANEPPADPPKGPGTGGTDPKPDDPGDKGDEPKFTQADLNKIGKKEKEAGKRAAAQGQARCPSRRSSEDHRGSQGSRRRQALRRGQGTAEG